MSAPTKRVTRSSGIKLPDLPPPQVRSARGSVSNKRAKRADEGLVKPVADPVEEVKTEEKKEETTEVKTEEKKEE